MAHKFRPVLKQEALGYCYGCHALVNLVGQKPSIDVIHNKDENIVQLIHQIFILISLWAGAAAAKGKLHKGSLFDVDSGNVGA